MNRPVDYLARRLHAAGCRFAFGMPGGEVLTMVDALETAGIRFVLAKHENAAGFMAEGVHHRTGAPAILVATVGPGALNGVNVVANALQDRVPMIVLTGAIDADEAQTYTHQVLDQGAVFRPITKASFRVDPGAAHVIADKAVGIATEGRPGPVHLDMPIGAAEVTRAAELRRAAPRRRRRGARRRDRAGSGATLAGRARRPVIVAGVDAMNEGAGAALAAFAERTACRSSPPTRPRV